MQGLVFIARTSPPYFVTYYLGPSHAPPVPCGTGVRGVRAWTSKRTFTPDPDAVNSCPAAPVRKIWEEDAKELLHLRPSSMRQIGA